MKAEGEGSKSRGVSCTTGSGLITFADVWMDGFKSGLFIMLSR